MPGSPPRPGHLPCRQRPVPPIRSTGAVAPSPRLRPRRSPQGIAAAGALPHASSAKGVRRSNPREPAAQGSEGDAPPLVRACHWIRRAVRPGVHGPALLGGPPSSGVLQVRSDEVDGQCAVRHLRAPFRSSIGDPRRSMTGSWPAGRWPHIGRCLTTRWATTSFRAAPRGTDPQRPRPARTLVVTDARPGGGPPVTGGVSSAATAEADSRSLPRPGHDRHARPVTTDDGPADTTRQPTERGES
jgi:hypothetical protein